MLTQLFSSPLLSLPSSEQRGPYLAHLRYALSALSYYLSRAIPRESHICLIHPKSLCSELLPSLLAEKKCTLSIVGGAPAVISKLMELGTVSKTIPSADIYLCEPAGFSEHGILVSPHESEHLFPSPLYAIGSILQYSRARLPSYDLHSAHTYITELGMHSHEHFLIEISRAFSSLALPAFSQSSLPQAPRSIPYRAAQFPLPNQ